MTTPPAAPVLPPASPPVGGPGHTADHITIAAVLSWLEAAVQALQGQPAAFALNGPNTVTVPGTTAGWASVTVSAVNRDGSPDILDFYYGAQKIFSLNSYGEPRITAAALTHVAEIIYVLSGQSADAWQVLSSSLAKLARVGPDGSASFAGPVSRQLPTGPAGWVHPALLAGWTSFTGRTFAMKLTNDNMVHISGHLAAGTATDGTVIATVPPGYAPLYRAESLPVAQFNAITPANYKGPYLEVEPDGRLDIFSFGTVTPGGRIVVGGRYPLDAN